MPPFLLCIFWSPRKTHLDHPWCQSNYALSPDIPYTWGCHYLCPQKKIPAKHTHFFRVSFSRTCLQKNILKHPTDVVAVLVVQIMFMCRKICRLDFIVNVCIPRRSQDIRLPPAPLDSVNIIIISVRVPNGGYNFHCIEDMGLTSIGNPVTTWLLSWPWLNCSFISTFFVKYVK